METTQRLQLAIQQLDRLLGFFPRVEGKASFLFAINLSLVTSAFAIVAWKVAIENLLVAVLLFLVFVLCASSLIALYFAYSPHLSPAQRPSLLYFRDIDSAGADLFSAQWKSQTHEQLLDDVLNQISRNAQILAKKFSATETAFALTAFAVIPWFVLIVFVVLRQQSFSVGT